MATKDIRFPRESTNSEGILESEVSFFTKSGSSPTCSASSNPAHESRTKTKIAHPQKLRKEPPGQRKLREAQELVKAAKKKEQEAWRAKW